jgi:two-component system, NtrC family, sensor kinase
VETKAGLNIIKKVTLSMYAFRRDEPRIKPIAPMQKVKLVIAAIILFHTGLHAQVSQETIAGLRAAYMQETNDSAKMYLAGQLANGYRFSKVDSANYYNDLARELAVKQGLGKAEAELLSLKSAIVLEEGKLPEALQYGFEALELAEKVDYVHIVGLTLNRIGNVYMELEDYRKALDYYQQSAAIFKKRKELLYYTRSSAISMSASAWQILRSTI